MDRSYRSTLHDEIIAGLGALPTVNSSQHVLAVLTIGGPEPGQSTRATMATMKQATASCGQMAIASCFSLNGNSS